ncbi:hypothetical protein [Streptomyces cacaoi]|uniref:hypothetical protein n=1 Tax=Streptomyces cacaoi TaxID=1898 RepID=UPI002623937D|nr:hypothetical protein [Streptomyces cacaoi]
MSTVLDYRAERRADRAAEAEQRRRDAAAAEERLAERQRWADERETRLRRQRQADKDAARRSRALRRAERARRRAQALAPQAVYRTGTLALVIASGLASLPAQVLHFAGISLMLLPLPFALEGAAWVMAAGVAHADARGLPAWVRWLLRVFVLAAAGFAAFINYGYGRHLPGLSASDATAAGAGLAAVTLLGPGLFEVRQWVCTLTASTGGAEDRSRRRHARLRRRHHRKVARLADRLVSAAPHGALSDEEAWSRAWEIETGTRECGMTPALHRRAAASAAELQEAKQPAEPQPESPQTSTDRSTPYLEKPRVVRALPLPRPVGPLKPADALKQSGPRPVRPLEPTRPSARSTGSAREPRRSTGRVQVPQAARSARPTRTPAELLDEARRLTADWSDAQLTAEGIRRAVRTSADKARALRDTLRAERDSAEVAA